MWSTSDYLNFYFIAIEYQRAKRIFRKESICESRNLSIGIPYFLRMPSETLITSATF